MNPSTRLVPRKRKALLIGIRYRWKISEQYKTLDGPGNDVKRMKAALTHLYHYREEDIVVMTDDQDREDLQSDLWPTRDNILKAIQALVHDANPGDSFLFHYAGHSTQVDALFDTNEDDGLDEVLISSDLREIVDDDLREHLVDKLPPGCRLTAILDACHSGTMLDLDHYHCHWFRRNSEPAMRSALDDTFVETLEMTVQPHANQLIERLHRGVLRARDKLKFSVFKSKATGILAIVRIRNAIRYARKADKKTEKKRCGRLCEHGEENGPFVVSISACSDHQMTWEDGTTGAAMTITLLGIMEKKPSVTVGELFKQLKSRLFDHAVKNHLKVLRFKNMFKATMPNEIRAGVDKMLQFEVQVPQLGSLNKLRMNEQFILGDASSTVPAYLQY